MSQVAAKVIREACICHLPDAAGLSSCSLSSPPHPAPPSPIALALSQRPGGSGLTSN